MPVITLNTLNQYNNADELLRLIIKINIEALEELLVDNQLKEWDLLLDNFQSSRNELKQLIRDQLDLYYRLKKEKYPTKYLSPIKPKWRNILMETLFILEEEFYAQDKSEPVVELWSKFFSLSVDKVFQPKLQLKGLIQNKYTKDSEI